MPLVKKMKIGLIGFGSIGQRHYNNLIQYKPEITVFSKRKDAPGRAVNSWGDFQKSGPFDAIFITNETYKHVPTVLKCLALKPKAIFVEKPIAHNLNGLAKIKAEVKKIKISLWVGYNFQFYKPFLKIREVLKRGAIGKIYYARVSVGQDLREWRKRDYRLNYGAKKSQGGGVMLDLVHEINYAGWILGEKLIPITALINKLSDLEIDTEDCADSLFKTRKGIIVSVHQDYLRKPGKRELELVGSKGTLAWDSESSQVSVNTGKGTKRYKASQERNEMFKDELRFFIGQLKSKKFFTNIEEAVLDVANIVYLKKHAKK